MAQQDDYYYEIQLTNKQLVFYFMAGATGLILAFLAGVMVGRSVERPGPEAQNQRAVRDERIVAEETPKPTPSPATSAEPLTYAQRLESDRPEETLERSKPGGSPAAPPSGVKATPTPSAAAPSSTTKPAGTATPPATPKPSPTAKPSAMPKPAPTPKTAPKSSAEPARPGTFTIQVGAFKDRSAAQAVVARLKGKGYAAYVVAPEAAAGGLFNVRVGSYSARVDAERVQAKLRDEKFDPFIIKR